MSNSYIIFKKYVLQIKNSEFMLFTWCEKSLSLSRCKIGWNSLFFFNVLWDWKTRKFNLVYNSNIYHGDFLLGRLLEAGEIRGKGSKDRKRSFLLKKSFPYCRFFFLCCYWDFILQQFPPFPNFFFFTYLFTYLSLPFQRPSTDCIFPVFGGNKRT